MLMIILEDSNFIFTFLFLHHHFLISAQCDQIIILGGQHNILQTQKMLHFKSNPNNDYSLIYKFIDIA